MKNALRNLSEGLQSEITDLFLSLSSLFGTENNISFWDEEHHKIIESVNYDNKWNILRSKSGNSRYGLFTLSTVLVAKNLFNLKTDLYDENISKFVKNVYGNLDRYSKSDLTYGGLTSLILGNSIYNLPEYNMREIEMIYDLTLNKVLNDYDNQDSLILIAGKYLNDLIPDRNRLQKLKHLADRYLISQNRKGYFETGDIRAIYHQRNMYVLWSLIFASYFYTEKAEEIKNAVKKNLGWVWKYNRDNHDDAFHWHPAFYWIRNKYGIKVPIINIKSSKYLFECHQTFFANAVNFYQMRFKTNEFQEEKERAISWIFGRNRINKILTQINNTGLPIRIMDLEGNLFIKGQQFKGSYEVGSYILSLAADNYFKSML